MSTIALFKMQLWISRSRWFVGGCPLIDWPTSLDFWSIICGDHTVLRLFLTWRTEHFLKLSSPVKAFSLNKSVHKFFLIGRRLPSTSRLVLKLSFEILGIIRWVSTYWYVYSPFQATFCNRGISSHWLLWKKAYFTACLVLEDERRFVFAFVHPLDFWHR